jgi:hydrogenase expression/formation protein HypE
MTVIRGNSLSDQMDRVERARRARRQPGPFRDERITSSHGAGGKSSRQLLEGLIVPILGRGALDPNLDCATFPADASRGRLAFTTDSYVVTPLIFPGGDIGSLAVHGTVNDLATAGAQPLGLSVSLILEEGLDVGILRQILQSIRAAADAADVEVVTGDTKVVPRGKADGLFLTTSGIGVIAVGASLSGAHVRPGDRVLINGSIGDHGIAVMLARDALEIEAGVQSDSAPLHRLAAALLHAAPGTRCLKDPTRGGIAAALNEIAQQARVGIAIDEPQIPVRPDVRAACEILGLDPWHIANEGKMLAIVPPDQVTAALDAMRRDTNGRDAAVIGEVIAEPVDMVVMRTAVGGSRVLDMLVGDPLPRIC